MGAADPQGGVFRASPFHLWDAPSVKIEPIVLPANQPERFYRGGERIAELRGEKQSSQFVPEDWVGSTATLFGQEHTGLTRLPDGRWLRDAVTEDPEAWLGSAHVATFGADPALLVKLLDAGQRLPVHCHPSNAFARRHQGSHFGKTEAWVVIGTSGADPGVHIGFADDVDEDVVAGWIAEQDSDAMLGALNSVRVNAGDTVFVPAGLPHAIGAGVFIVELQQPTDLALTLEWRGFLPDDTGGHQGLGYSTALGCLDRTGWRDRLDSIVTRDGTADPEGTVDLFGDAVAPFFRAERLRVREAVAVDASFAVLVVLEGAGRMSTALGGSLDLKRGQTVLVPHAAGAATIAGELTAVRCLPPMAGG
jgi:mannose-6-phosphate isomerase